MLQDVTVERLGPAGEGLAAGGLRVPFALPGERLRGTARDGLLTDAEVLEPVPERVAPPCRHFGLCGGCALQHASDGFLAAWKTALVERTLAAQGLAAEMRPPHVSPQASRRRAVLGGRRTRKTVVVGFHGRRSDTLFDLAECPMSRPEIVAAKPALAALTTAGAARSRPLRLSVTHGPAGLDVAVQDGRPLDPLLRRDLAAIAEASDLARLAWEGEVVALRRPSFQEFGPARVVPPPGAFLQATAEGEAALAAAVVEALGDARRVVDLFAGCGTFTLPTAVRAEVLAVEAGADMLAALDAGWRQAPGLRRVRTERRDLFRRPLLARELAGFDGAVLDAPRAGAEAQCRELAAAPVPRLAMLSCNPATFARDTAILAAGGFRLEWVQVVDQFRWSPHVELAARLVR